MSCGEVIVAGRHRRVRGEHRVGGHRLERGVEARPRRASARMRSRTRNAAWPSLMCQTVGLSPSASQRAHAAHAEHDLLLDARRAVAAVELVGDVAILARRSPRRRCRAGTACTWPTARAATPCTSRVRPGNVDVDVDLGCRRAPAPARSAGSSNSESRVARLLVAFGVDASARSSPGGRAAPRRRTAGACRWRPCSGRRRGCRGRPSRSESSRGSRTRRRNRRPGRSRAATPSRCGAAARCGRCRTPTARG